MCSSSITHVPRSATIPTDYVTELCHMILGGYMWLHFSLPVLPVSLTDLHKSSRVRVYIPGPRVHL